MPLCTGNARLVMHINVIIYINIPHINQQNYWYPNPPKPPKNTSITVLTQQSFSI